MCTACVCLVRIDDSADEEHVVYADRIPRSFLQLTVNLVSGSTYDRQVAMQMN